MNDIVGSQGHVTIPIHGMTKPGEVLVQYGGFTHKYAAFADQEIAEGTEVWVTAVRGGHALEVAATR